jgi:hypothetical protein
MIYESIKNLLAHYQHNRQAGHSTLVAKIAKELDGFIICPNIQSTREFEKGLAISVLEIDKLRGTRKPTFIDNFTLIEIFREVDFELSKYKTTKIELANCEKELELLKIQVVTNTTRKFGHLPIGLNIEEMEKRGQIELIYSSSLPIFDSERYDRIVLENYKRLGIIILKTYDIFHKVYLPDNMKLEPTEHSVWTNLTLNGKVIAEIFYKAAHYDRSAFIRFV